MGFLQDSALFTVITLSFDGKGKLGKRSVHPLFNVNALKFLFTSTTS